ncbi:hypothetical protein BJY01DRAFT_254886 [Aspergillus pseudoustus]|uniref:Fungal-specific transcription factor domain-containing protein n=1 Tax=Aspergillus pseudoustus TaxID=1810923 RepID=A0ABR4IPY3_9EURO
MSDHDTQPDFLFVFYEDGKPHNRAISRQKAVFAQKAHQRKKRIAAVERLKNSTLPFRQRLPLAYNAVPDSSTTSPDAESEYDDGSTTPDPAEEDGIATAHLQLMAIAQLNDLWSPQSQLGQGFIDPFSTTAVSTSKSMNLYWHHYRHFILPLAYPLNSSPMGAWWWQKGLSEPVVHLTLLVSAASHKIAMDTVNNAPSQDLQRSIGEFLGIQGDTIKRLNYLLRDPSVITESTILVVAALRAIEAISCNFDSVAVHTEGLNTLIQLHGGLEHLDHQTLFQIYHSDIMYAALTNTTPARPLTARWRSEILQETNVFYSSSDLVSHLKNKPKIMACLSTIGTSFFEASWYIGLADTMKPLLRASHRLIQYYEAARLQQSTVLQTDNSLFLVLGHQLMSIRYPESPTPVEEVLHDPQHTGLVSCLLNEPLRITLFIYLNMRIWNFQEYPIMAILVNTLRETLLYMTGTNKSTSTSTRSPAPAPAPALVHLKTTAPDVLFWILFIGGMAARGHTDAHYSWFVDELVELAAFLNLRQWAIAREVLGGFFYTDQAGGEELWEQIVSITGFDGYLFLI